MKKNQEEDFIHIQDLLKLSISKWRWFVLSVAISLFIAFLYIAITIPIYTRSASVLIKDNSKNGMSSDNMSVFSDMGMFKSNININNEILTFKSPLLMEEVVKRLGLEYSYRMKGFFRNKVLYKESPIVVSFDSINVDEPFSFCVELLPQNRISIMDFILDEEEIKSFTDQEFAFGETINTPAGNIVIQPTSHYTEECQNQQIIFSKNPFSEVVKHYIEGLNIILGNEDATIIDISLNDVSTSRAEDILETLIAVYNESWVEDKNQIALSTSYFIGERLRVIENELGGVDDNISKFKSQNLLPDIQVASNIYMMQSSENNEKILTLNTQYTIANYILSYLKDPATKEQLLPANMGVESIKIEGQISEYNTLLLKRNTMLANSSSNNPLIQDMEQSLDAMRKVIIHSIDNLLVSLNTQIKDIQKSEKQTNQRIASNPEQAKHLLSIERQQKVKEALYLYLLQKREETQLSQTFTAYNTKIIAPPAGKLFPTAPQKKTILLIALVIGLVVPVIVIFILENLNTTVRGRKDLALLTLPFVGEIPQVVKNKKSLFKGNGLKVRDDIIVGEGNKDYMNEAFRVVRTNLDFMINTNDEKRRKVILFTSFNIGSGKTFTIINLAISMAIKGKKVAIVDLDMRKASLSTYINSPSKGVSNYLGKMTSDLDEVIQKESLHPNLDIIPVGTIPPNPAELLLDNKLAELLNELRERYDYIFLDCTPVEMLTDAAIVGKVTDLTIFVIRAGLLDRRVLPELEEIYQKGQYNNMSLLLNGSTYIEGKYGYNRHGYNYGYGGDYGNNNY